MSNESCVNVESRRAFHFGVNFVVTPAPTLDRKHSLDFEGRLAEAQIEFEKSAKGDTEIAFVRSGAHPLKVRVKQIGPPIAQLMILAPQPGRGEEIFIREAEAACKAYGETWPQPFQIIARDCTVRHLYSTTTHAFQYLWEKRLAMSGEELRLLGKPVLGGGLRVVMPPTEDDQEPVQIEVKVESYLKDSSMLFVETQFSWPAPSPPGTSMDPRACVDQVNRYAFTEVVEFLRGKGGSV